MSKLTEMFLSGKNNIPINTELAVAIGLNETIVLRQVYYWIEHNRSEKKNYIDGKYWVYNSMKQWRSDNFPFMSEKTIERAFSSLRKKNLIIVGDYSKDRMKRPNWYTVNEEEFNKLIMKLTKTENQYDPKNDESKEDRELNETDSLNAYRQNDCMESDTPTDCYNIYNNINNTSTEITNRDNITENTDNSLSNDKDNSKSKDLELYNSPVPEKQESRMSMSIGIKQKQPREKSLKDMPTRAKEMADALVDDSELPDGVRDCISYFLCKYAAKNHTEHLPLKNDTLQAVVEVMLSSITIQHDEDIENEYQTVFYPLVCSYTEWEDRKKVIDEYFDTKFNYSDGSGNPINVDYSLVHFTQKEVITHVMQKCYIGDDYNWYESEPVN